MFSAKHKSHFSHNRDEPRCMKEISMGYFLGSFGPSDASSYRAKMLTNNLQNSRITRIEHNNVLSENHLTSCLS